MCKFKPNHERSSCMAVGQPEIIIDGRIQTGPGKMQLCSNYCMYLQITKN